MPTSIQGIDHHLCANEGKTLTDDDLDIIEGRQQLIGKLEERYGNAKEVAKNQFREFIGRLRSTRKAA